MIATLSALALASAAAPTQIYTDPDSIPRSLASLKLADFGKRVLYRQRDELAAERVAKKANCDLPVDGYQWVAVRVEAAVYYSAAGNLQKVIPASMGCPALEKFVADHLSKNARNAGPVGTASPGQWYRTSMQFRWPG
jgi:hypothetical protein